VTYLLDTNAISESRRPKRAHPKYKAWVDTVPADLCYVSAISILEIELARLRGLGQFSGFGFKQNSVLT
jgi:toxin FitB